MEKGLRTRMRLSEIGLGIAASEGFEAVTLERLSFEASFSRAGVFKVFGSVAALRRDLVRTGLDYWREEILEPAQPARGMRSIWDAWARWLRRATTLPLFLELLPGIAEADATHPEAELRNEVVKHWRRWERFVIGAVDSAADTGELVALLDGALLNEELLRLAGSLPWLSRVRGTDEALRRIAVAMFDRIGASLRTPIDRSHLTTIHAGYCAPGSESLGLAGDFSPDVRGVRRRVVHRGGIGVDVA